MKEIKKIYKVELKLRIDWSEQDYFGHVNNVSFFKYIQAARVNYWDQIGLTLSHIETKKGPMLLSCSCDFKKPLFYPGDIVIYSKIDFIRNTSFGLHHIILNEKEEIAAEAKDVMVMFDFKTNQKISFPEVLKKKIEKLENKTI